MAILFCAWLIAVDPYSWSQWGIPYGELRPSAVPNVAWQGPIAALLVGCLGLGLALLPLQRRKAFHVLVVESAAYLVVNLVLLARDGSGRIADASYGHVGVGLDPFVGLAVRLYLLRQLSGPVIDPVERGRLWAWSEAPLALVVMCAAMILLDPYSWGHAGYGWSRASARPDTSWQGLFAVCLVASLALGALVYARTRRLAFTIFLVECAAYFLVNIALVARDGSGRFSSASFLHVGGGLFVFLGLGLRLMLLQQARRREAGTP